MKKKTKLDAKAFQVFDSVRVQAMGWDEGYMGYFTTLKEAIKFSYENEALFEGLPVFLAYDKTGKVIEEL